MDVKEAVRVAKDYVRNVFAAEEIVDVALEEIERDDLDVWHITIGFLRPSKVQDSDVVEKLKNPFLRKYAQRSFKVVNIDDREGKVLSLKDRELPVV